MVYQLTISVLNVPFGKAAMNPPRPRSTLASATAEIIKKEIHGEIFFTYLLKNRLVQYFVTRKFGDCLKEAQILTAVVAFAPCKYCRVTYRKCYKNTHTS